MAIGLERWVAARGVLDAATSALTVLSDGLEACPSQDLGELLGTLSLLSARAEAARVLVVREAMARGVVTGSEAACPADWVTEHSGPSTQRRDALALSRVAATAALPGYEVLDTAVRAGRVGPGMAEVVIREFARLRPALADTMHQDVLAGMVSLAEQGCSPRQLAQLRDELIGRYGREGLLDRTHARLRARRGMTAFGQDLHGMYHAVVTLDPASHAVIAPVLQRLSAPTTGTDVTEPDTRSADQRRADALVEVCATYQSLGQRVRGGISCRVLVTMSLDDLQARTGNGLTTHGDVLSPAEVRTMACDAGIIPAVLGSASQPLDLGRETRLATPAQTAALWHRDRGCTFPGCNRPPGFCQAHHIQHWIDGGATSLDNLALLCRRHHTIVHQRGYSATVSQTGVTWLTAPGTHDRCRAGPGSPHP